MQLDPLCAAIDRTDSDEIRILPGERIHALRDGQRRDLGREIVDAESVRGLALQLLPGAELDSLRDARSLRVRSGEKPFDVVVANTTAGLAMIIRRVRVRAEPPAGDRDSEPQASRHHSGIAPRPVAQIDQLLRHPMVARSSDLHLTSGLPPAVRIDGELQFLDNAPFPVDDVLRLIGAVWTERAAEEYSRAHEVDFAYHLDGVARFRVHVFDDQHGACASLRRIHIGVPPLEKLGLPQIVAELCTMKKGLVLVTGPTGSGKSTTIAGMIDYINRNRGGHIVTLEDPIEFVHASARALVNQREVGLNTQSFKSALRAAMREDPDVVVVGEMRDFETVAMAVETAETGHLVIGALHTTGAVAAIDRVIDQFPGSQQDQIRFMLAENLKAVIAQTLCRRARGGRVVAAEVMLGVAAISNLIRERKTFQIPSVIQTSKGTGMVTMNDALLALVQQGEVTAQEARLHAPDRNAFVTNLKAVGLA